MALAAVLGAALALAPVGGASLVNVGGASLVNVGGYLMENGYQTTWGKSTAQIFTPSQSGVLVDVQLYLGVFGSPGTQPVSIYAVGADGTPTGNALATADLTTDQISASYPVDAILPAPGVSLTAGQPYAIVLASNGDQSDNVQWTGENSATPGLPFYIFDNGQWAGEQYTEDFQAEIDAPPSVSVPAGVSMPATGSTGATVNYPAATATDALGNSLTPTCKAPSGSTFGIGQTQVTCTATDAYGVSGSSEFPVTVTGPTTPPSITGANDITAPATGTYGADVTFPLPTATDVYGNPASVGCSPGSGDTFAIGKTTVNCSAYDLYGNVSSTFFTVTVTPPTAPPTFGGVADVTATATSASGATVSYTAPTAADTFGNPATVACLPATATKFAIGSTPVTCTATDVYGNTETATFQVKVSAPATAPTLQGASDVTAQAPSSAGTPVTYAIPSATDVFGNPAKVACLPASGTTFPVGTTSVTCTATDAYGNSKSETFNVIVSGTAPKGGTPGAPKATITVPASGAKYRRGTTLRALFKCADGAEAPGITSCTGSNGNGSRLNTTTPGVHTFTVTARSSDGQIVSNTVKYTIEVPSNRFTAVKLTPLSDGSIDVTLRVPGPGVITALVTAWKDNFAGTASVLQPAAGRVATGRAGATARKGGLITVHVVPNASGRELVLHHTYPVTLRTWITFTPTGGFERSKGWYGLTLP
jgi:hypothetical protein